MNKGTTVQPSPAIFVAVRNSPGGNRGLFIFFAVLVTFFFHLAAFMAARFWMIPPPSSMFESVTRPFKITEVFQVPDDPEGSRSAGDLESGQPGADPGEAKPPETQPLVFEQAFSMELPNLGVPPSANPLLDQAPVAAMPEASIPSLLPTSPNANIITSPVAPLDPNAVPNGTQISVDPVSAFAIPESRPGSLASENTVAVEGGGMGVGGEGAGDLPAFHDLEKLISPDLRKIDFNPDGAIIRLSNEVLFDFDSDTLRSEAMPILKKIADIIAKKYPDSEVTIEGHTDTIGDADYNFKLSERRAHAVAYWLKDGSKLAASKVLTIGYGKTRPIANPYGSIQEQKPNRRVEIHIRAKRAEKRTG